MPRTWRVFSDASCDLEVWAVELPDRASRRELTHALRDEVRGGRPHASITHTDGLGLVAVADRPVGVDAELVRPRPTLARVVARVAAEAHGIHDQRALYLLWCGREAHAKAHGVPLDTLRDATVEAMELDVGEAHVAALVVA